MKITQAEILKQVADSEFIMGECNCSRCSTTRMDKVFAEAIKEVYPSLSFLPRVMDSAVQFGNRQNGFREQLGSNRRIAIIEALIKLKKSNNTIRAKLVEKGISGRTFCADCGTLHAKTHTRYVNLMVDRGITWEKKPLCPACIEKYYFSCNECDTYHPITERQNIVLEKKWHDKREQGDRLPAKAFIGVCHDCYETRFARCYRCSLYLRPNDWINVTQAVNRPPRQIRVRSNNTLLSQEEFVEDEAATSPRFLEMPGAVLCKACHKKEHTICTQCGDELYMFNHYNNADGDVICPQCHDDAQLIHAHNYRPKKFRYKTSKNQPDKYKADVLHYGIELEVEDMGIMNKGSGKFVHLMDREEMAVRALDFMGREDVYVVHDGSLTRSPMGGIEIVSHPMTWEYYRENSDRWTELLMKLREWGGQAFRPGTCGLHYHMTKGAFSTFQLYKFTDFFFKKSAMKFVTALAHRHGHDRYARWHKEDSSNCKFIAKNKKNASGDRYAAVNLINKHTVELRMFKGSLEPLYFHKNMEFLHALYEYSRDSKPAEMTVTKFMSYVNANCNRFPCLLEYVKHNNDISRHYPSVIMSLKKGV